MPMNRETIKKTALVVYDEKNKEYIVRSPLLEICSGIGDTKKEAWQNFEILLEAMYVEYLEGKRVGTYQLKEEIKRGRPPKGGVKINTQVRETTKDTIAKLSEEFDCSYGEAIDYLSGYFMNTCAEAEYKINRPPRKAKVVKRKKS